MNVVSATFAKRKAIRLAPFGRHTRYMLAAYLRRVLMVASILLAIALTIDLWPQFAIVADTGDGTLGAIWAVIRFAALRTPGLIAPFFPFATFLGVLWTELTHTLSRERMLVWNSGRSPIQCLSPVIILGLLLGAAEFTMDAYMGPAAMGVQMRERLGLDGQRLDRTKRGDSHWIALPDGLLNAEIEYGPPAVLRHVTLYRRDADGALTESDIAEVAHRVPGTDLWLLENGQYWSARTPGQMAGANGPMIPFTTRTVAMELDPVWLSVFGMEVQYLPLPVLRDLAHKDKGIQSKGLYRTRIQVLYGEALLPGAMALLASTLSLLLLTYTTPPATVTGIVFAGYLAHFGSKACLLLGQNGYIVPRLAGWFVPGVLIVTIVVVLLLIERRRKAGLNA